jgi:hypothetical protein
VSLIPLIDHTSVVECASPAVSNRHEKCHAFCLRIGTRRDVQMSNRASSNRGEGDGHHSPITGTFGTEIVYARRARGAEDVAGRRAPAIIRECSSASRRSASLRPRSAGLTVLTPIPRSP